MPLRFSRKRPVVMAGRAYPPIHVFFFEADVRVDAGHKGRA